MIRVGDIARIIEEPFRLDYALPGDNCGLQTGDSSQPVRGILVALDPSPAALARARSLKANLLVTHHPLLYEPLKTVDTASLTGAAVRDALSSGTAVYAAHTNLDAAPQGLARELARRAGLGSPTPFPRKSTGRWQKVAVFVPEEAAGQVHRAMSRAGAGKTGNYDMCGFSVRGEGMFRPLAGARPAVGSRGRLERVGEVRLEMIVDGRNSGAVIEAMKKIHPYEEVAYDLYPLRLPDEAAIGYVGHRAPVGARALARQLGATFRTEVRLSGSPPSRVTRIAVVPGSGGGYLHEAERQGAEILVTGEVRYHQALEAEHLGMGIMELGHDRSEMAAVDLLAGAIRRGLSGGKTKIRVDTYRRPKATASLKGR